LLKARKKGKQIKKVPPVETKGADAKKEPKPYKKLLIQLQLRRGLIDVHKIDNKYLFEIPDSILGSEMMTITRYSKTPAGGIFGGEEVNRQVVRWDKANNILPTYVIMSPDENKPMAQAVKNSTSDPIIGNYDVL
jgi:hypothetical protein